MGGSLRGALAGLAGGGRLAPGSLVHCMTIGCACVRGILHTAHIDVSAPDAEGNWALPQSSEGAHKDLRNSTKSLISRSVRFSRKCVR